MNELTDSQLEIVTGRANYNQCLNELYVWVEHNPSTTLLEVYNKFKVLCDENYYEFTESEKIQAAQLLECLKENL